MGCENQPVPHPSVFSDRTWPPSTFLCPETVIPHAGTGDPFVGWVQPTANGVRPVGCTHPTMTQSLPCEVYLLGASLQTSSNKVRQEDLIYETGMTLESRATSSFHQPTVKLLCNWPSFFVKIELKFRSGATPVHAFLRTKRVPHAFRLYWSRDDVPRGVDSGRCDGRRHDVRPQHPDLRPRSSPPGLAAVQTKIKTPRRPHGLLRILSLQDRSLMVNAPVTVTR
jgi:hypothetical protein